MIKKTSQESSRHAKVAITTSTLVETLLMRLAFSFVILTVAVAMLQAKGGPDTILRVACVGDSITQGSGYPKRLAEMLNLPLKFDGPENQRPAGGMLYKVENFGVGGSTMMMKSDRPYAKEKAYRSALDFKPDIVILMLGTNDTRKANPNTYEHIADFVADGTKIVESFQALSSKPKIFLCLPVPIYGVGNYGLTNENLIAGVLPGVRKIADATKVTLLDMNTPLSGHAEWFGDRIHPNGEGAKMIAATAFRAITGKDPPAALMPAPAKK